MSSRLLDRAMSPQVLDESWRRLRNEHTPWSVGVSREELQWHFLQHIIHWRESVLEGDYRPAPLRRFPMKKPDGGQRIITSQYLCDKLLQRALLTVLGPRAEKLFHENSYAYRPRRGVQHALNKAREQIRCGLDWLVDTDIHKFFDSIPHQPLLKKLKVFVSDRKVMKLIEAWLKQGAHSNSLLNRRQGIPQGAILSPLMCNLYLNEFDRALASANIPFVRFADDVLLFAESKNDASRAKVYAEDKLQQLGLKLHPEKTRIIRSSPEVVFLGEKLPPPSR